VGGNGWIFSGHLVEIADFDVCRHRARPLGALAQEPTPIAFRGSGRSSSRPSQFDFAPENLTTVRHFSVSSSMNVAAPAGELRSTVAPKLASLAAISGSARAALISLLSAETISRRSTVLELSRISLVPP